jgi:hypothetical protein
MRGTHQHHQHHTQQTQSLSSLPPSPPPVHVSRSREKGGEVTAPNLWRGCNQKAKSRVSSLVHALPNQVTVTDFLRIRILRIHTHTHTQTHTNTNTHTHTHTHTNTHTHTHTHKHTQTQTHTHTHTHQMLPFSQLLEGRQCGRLLPRSSSGVSICTCVPVKQVNCSRNS